MITEQYIPCRYFSQVYDGTHVMAGHCGGGSTSIVETRKQKDSLCALPNHQLYLVVVHAMSVTQAINDFLHV